MGKTSKAALVIAVGLLWTTPVVADVLRAPADWQTTDPGPTLYDGSVEGAYVFVEREHDVAPPLALYTELPIAAGTYSTVTPPPSEPIPLPWPEMGAFPVDSHLVHFDSAGETTAEGAIRFDGEIIAIIFRTASLQATTNWSSDRFNFADTDSRGLELDGASPGPDEVRIDPDGFTLHVRLSTGGLDLLDEMRVLTRARPTADVNLDSCSSSVDGTDFRVAITGMNFGPDRSAPVGIQFDWMPPASVSLSTVTSIPDLGGDCSERADGFARCTPVSVPPGPVEVEAVFAAAPGDDVTVMVSMFGLELGMQTICDQMGSIPDRADAGMTVDAGSSDRVPDLQFSGGGCAASGNAHDAGGWLLGLVAIAWLRRRRRSK